MNLIEFLNMFYSLDTDINRIVVLRNGRCICEKAVGDTRCVRQEYREAKVKNFTLPKGTHALYVILENKEEAK